MNHDKAFTHGGIFHADDVFSAALLRMMNPDIFIERGNQVPNGYDGLIFVSAAGYLTITRRIAESGKMVFRLRLWIIMGKVWGKFSGE